MSHHHHHIDPGAGDRRVAFAVAVNVLLTVVQIAGGILSGSVALLADAAHNLSDALSLAIAFIARRIARRPSDGAMTFGYGRAEVVAALVNYSTLIVIGLYLAFEAAWRLADPPGVDGWMVVVVAGGALVVDVATALLTLRLSRESMNIRAAFVHNLADALGSLGVIVAGGLILLYDWRLADPLATLGIAGYILWTALREIGPVIRILMLGSPPGLEAQEVLTEMERVAGVESVHHLHLWQLDEHRVSLEAHVVVDALDLATGREIGVRLRARLREAFGIRHVTLDVESRQTACVRPHRIGGGPG